MGTTLFIILAALSIFNMSIISITLIVLVALEHFYFLYFEMFAWETIGKRTFKSIPENLFTPTKTLAANQGLYNGFLGAGLIWSVLINNATWHVNVASFFLCCVIIAGTYGGITASKRIFFAQAIPAILALIVVLLK